MNWTMISEPTKPDPNKVKLPRSDDEWFYVAEVNEEGFIAIRDDGGEK